MKNCLISTYGIVTIRIVHCARCAGCVGATCVVWIVGTITAPVNTVWICAGAIGKLLAATEIQSAPNTR
jgi:hypothetical protein